jgi:hypothetical protein
MAREFYAYLKLKNFKGTDLEVDTIPLRLTSVGISVDKTIPAFPLPLSGLATGESTTLALDLGMSNKRMNLSGFIVSSRLKRSHTTDGGAAKSLFFSAHEIAQMIASGVDSTGLAKYQAFDELVILMPSFVDSNYAYRTGIDTTNPHLTTEDNIPLIPFTFKSRGAANSKDNTFVALRSAFPDLLTDSGVKGFIASFSPTLSAESVEIEFSMDFQVATVLP